MNERVRLSLDRLIGKNLQTLRVSKGLSQAELASAISTATERIPQQTIVRIEKGTRPIKFAEAVRLCRALDVQLDSLVGEDGEVKNDRALPRLHRTS